ncbi:MAG: hypothetical protein FJ295_21640 [Planctomycetes bacterium]|nr:hypothetical protein [Planctomycetota bacterium]
MLWCLTLICAIVGGIGYFVSQGDLVAAGVLAAIGLLGMSGYRMRFSGFLALVTGVIVAGLYAARCGAVIESTVAELLHWNSDATRLASVSIAGLFLTLVTTTLVRSLTRFFCRADSLLDHSDCMGGFLVGSLQGALFAVCALGSILAVEPMAQRQRQNNVTSVTLSVPERISQGVVLAADRTRASCLFPFLERVDLYEWVPQLKALKQTLNRAEPSELAVILLRALPVPSSSPVTTQSPPPLPAIRQTVDAT